MNHAISVIIPVWNEPSLINDTVRTIFTLHYEGDLEVIAVDGSAEGETIRAIRDKRVRTLTSERGRSRQMNRGAYSARGDILLFLHADTTLPPNALKEVSRVMAEGEVVAGAFDLEIQSGRPVFRLIESAASLRSRITRMPYGDQAIFIRKDYFHAIGCFREMPLMEDVELMRRIRKAGDKISIIPERVKTSPRRWEKEGILICTLRNWALITLYFLGVSPERLVRFYR
jgi:rSAM/selenodomain-associated transferase 2